MNILVTGKGSSGSWQIRGVQLGAALGARVVPMATEAECRHADVVIGVKRLPLQLLDTIKRSQTYFVWDCVDAWPQKHTHWDRSQAIDWARAELARMRPNHVLWPNDTAKADIDRGGSVLRHHCMANQPINPIRKDITTIGYQGSDRYLNSDIIRAIDKACHSVGASFSMNPAHLADVDVCLALRGHEWTSYPQQHWKPATKLTNAHATGTPWIGNSEMGYKEVATGLEVFVDDPRRLIDAVEGLRSQELRMHINRAFVRATYTAEDAAADLKAILSHAR